MVGLPVLLLATPIFGLALEPPAIEPSLDLSVHVVAQLDLDGSAELSDGASEAEESEDSPFEDDGDTVSEEGDGAGGDEDSYAAQMKTRNSLASLHRPLGIATWTAMTATLALGFIQYYNLYGFFDDQGSNPCVQGDAIFGQEQCTGFPAPHAIAAGVTTGLYATTLTLALMMPDPDDLASGKGEFASTLRLHKLLRWVHLGGMVAQVVLGVMIANGMVGDRANDYDTLQTLATVHLAAGVVTWGALTWAGALMTF